MLEGIAAEAADLSLDDQADHGERTRSVELVLRRARIELERIQQRRRLESERSALRAVFDCIPGLVFAKDLQLRYFLANQTICEFNGLTQAEFLGRRYEEMPFLEPCDEIQESDRRALDGELVITVHELVNQGESRHFRGSKGPIWTSDRELIGVAAVYLEVSDLKRAQDQLKLANAFQAAVIQKATEGVCVLTCQSQERQATVKIWNEALVRLTGFTHEQVLNLPLHLVLRHLIPRASRRSSIQRIRQIVAGSDLDQEEQVLVTTTGEERIVMLSTSRINSDPTALSFVIFVRDLTATRKIQNRLAANEERYRLATQYSNSSVWQWDVRTGNIETDGHLESMLGFFPVREVPRDFWKERIHPDDLPGVTQTVREFLDGRSTTLRFVNRMRHAEGHFLWFECVAQYLRNDQNSRIVIGINRNVTAQQQATEEVELLRMQLQRITQMTTLGEVAAGLVHEITQPVTAIRSYAATARKVLPAGELSPPFSEIAGYLQKIEMNAVDTAEIVQGLRSLASTTHLKLTPQKLGSLIDQSLRLIQPELTRTQVQVVRQRDGDGQLVNVHTHLILHVLTNLIINACESLERTVSTWRQLRIATLPSVPEDQHVTIVVSDNGPGISPEVRHSLFFPFASTKPGGMGMGLAICKRILDAHAGEIEACFEESPGATFRVRLRQFAAGKGTV